MTHAARLLIGLAALMLLGTVAMAQDDVPTHLRGIIVAVEGARLEVKENDGTKTIVGLLPNAKVLVARKASFADVTPGTWVGVATVGPDGLQDALEVHVFPGPVASQEAGQSRWDLGRHSRMVVGIAGRRSESYDGQTLVVTFKDGESTIQVRPNTPVTTLTPGTPTDLKAGAAIFVRDGERQPDGSIAVDGLVVGAAGVVPPM